MYENHEFVNCNLCNSPEYFVMHYYNKISIVKCKNCGLVYRNPMPIESANIEFYSSNYYGASLGAQERIMNARKRLFKIALARINKIKRPDLGHLLDIGCGRGDFLKYAQEAGWRVEGVELAKTACDYAKKQFDIEIINKPLKDANFKENSFDVITLWNVLDHLTDTLDTLREINKVLKFGGILLVRIPNVSFHLFMLNIFSLFNNLIGKKEISGLLVIHNYGFSHKTIKLMLEKAGFKRVRVYNSPLSCGDPYRSFEFIQEGIVNLLKSVYFFVSELVNYFSLGHIKISSSFLVFAEKR